MKHGMIPRKAELLLFLLLIFRYNPSLWDGKKVESTPPFSKKINVEAIESAGLTHTALD